MMLSFSNTNHCANHFHTASTTTDNSMNLVDSLIKSKGCGESTLKQMILQHGRVIKGTNILKVDSFLNHQIDPELSRLMGMDIASRFILDGVTKVLTLETSGIPIALMAALYLNVPLVYARKVKPSTLTEQIYATKVHSFTKNVEYDVCVSAKYLQSNDKVLIIDDFLACGQATQGLIDIIHQAGASIVGVGISIEKGFQEGGKKLREQGVKLESLAVIDRFTEESVIFRQ